MLIEIEGDSSKLEIVSLYGFGIQEEKLNI
jgi:hypothetical protein